MFAPLLLLLQAAPQAPYPEVVTRSRADCSRGVDFHALVAPETGFVGQQATYQLGVFLDQETRARLRRNPEFLPPESRSMLSYDLPDRGSVLTGTIAGHPCEVHVFRRALFPLTAGRYEIPAARLSYALPQSPGFFSREESYSLRSEPVILVAIEPPSAARPADWAGAVGSWRASARVDSARGRAGATTGCWAGCGLRGSTLSRGPRTGRRSRCGGPAPKSSALEAPLADPHKLQDVEGRLTELEERLDFTERVLVDVRARAQPPPKE